MNLARYSKKIRIATVSAISLLLLAGTSVAQSANGLSAVRVEETGLIPSLDGLHVTLSLDSEVSSKLPTGASFRALLKEPAARQGKTVLPQGTLFEGHLKTVRARRPMRAGSVFMVFDRMILPGSTTPANVSANVTATDSDAAKTGAEGQLRPAISKKRLVFQLGGTALAAKLSDDLSEAIGGTAISAGTARYAGMAGAATFFLFQKGREVKLHPGEKIEIDFGR